MKLILISFLVLFIHSFNPPEVKVAGAMKNFMMEGDLSSHICLDTLVKNNLYGLGPVSGLHGELMILDGKIYSTSKKGNKLINQVNKVNKAPLFVYSHIKKWKAIELNVNVKTYSELETLIENTARDNNYDIEIPFAFKIEANINLIKYHVIEWKDNETHTMENHMRYAYNGEFKNKPVTLLGFYSTHHQRIFTHHTTHMHIHVMDNNSKTIGQVAEINQKGKIVLYLPE